jgi:cell division protein FtsW (lipid II flippase)
MYSNLEEDFHKIVSRREGLLLLITAAFVFCNGAALSLATDGRIAWAHLWAPFAWAVAVALAHFLLSYLRPDHDPFFLPLFALLSGWGLVLVDRLAPNFLPRQVLWVLLGTGALLIVAILPRNLRILRHYRYTWLLAGLFLLASTLLFGVNPSGFGAALWLPIPLPFIDLRVFLQPSELLKLLLVIFLASYFADREAALRQGQSRDGLRGALPYLAPLLLMWGFCMVLLVWQRDLGTATLYFLVFLALLYLATNDSRYIWFGLLLLLAAAAIAYVLFDVVALRVDAWWNPWPEALDRAFQIVQSLYAVAAGGIFGQGPGQGFPTFIPVVHSDFVFAAVAEEWGLIGSLGLVAVFMILTYRGFRSALQSLRPFRTYLAVGITLLFAIQALMIMGGVTKILPLTGVTLPFISYGGSSLLISSIMLGLLLFLSSEN